MLRGDSCLFGESSKLLKARKLRKCIAKDEGFSQPATTCSKSIIKNTRTMCKTWAKPTKKPQTDQRK